MAHKSKQPKHPKQIVLNRYATTIHALPQPNLNLNTKLMEMNGLFTRNSYESVKKQAEIMN